MRAMLLTLSERALTDVLRGAVVVGYEDGVSDEHIPIPADARVEASSYDIPSMSYRLRVHSESFREVPEFAVLPQARVVFARPRR